MARASTAAIIEPGFFGSSSVQLAVAIGAVVALVTAAVGVFTVMRGQAFAGEALGDIGATGGSSAYLVGVAPLWGFVALTLAAAGVMEMIGIQRARGRDLATGIVLGAGFGLAALFLYLGTTSTSTTGATVTILFGSIFALSSSTLPLVLALGAVSAAIIAVIYRPLLLSSVSPELAAARGLPGPVDRRAVPGRAGARGRARGGHDRRDPVDRAADRSRGHGATADDAAGPRDRDRRGDRRRRDVARDRARVRQLRLAAASPRLAGQLLRRHAGADRLHRRPRFSAPGAAPGRSVFSGFMVNTWIVATIVAIVGGAVGFFVVLRGSAFVAHAVPNGSFAGAAAANLIGDQRADRAGRVLARRRARDRPARPPRAPRRRDRVDARVHARAGRAAAELQRRVRAGDLLAAVRRGARDQHHRARPHGRAGRRVPGRARADLPAAAAVLGAAGVARRRAASTRSPWSWRFWSWSRS